MVIGVGDHDWEIRGKLFIKWNYVTVIERTWQGLANDALWTFRSWDERQGAQDQRRGRLLPWSVPGYHHMIILSSYDHHR